MLGDPKGEEISIQLVIPAHPEPLKAIWHNGKSEHCNTIHFLWRLHCSPYFSIMPVDLRLYATKHRLDWIIIRGVGREIYNMHSTGELSSIGESEKGE
jgi:hypothetical protein